MIAARSQPPPLLHMRGVTFHYDQTTAAIPGFTLRDVNLSLAAGELIAVIGHNGSGKSTLARLGNGLLRPTSGQVLIDGAATNGRSVAELAARVGYLFQNPDHQLFAATVADDVAFGPRNLGLPPAAVEERVQTVLAELGLHAVAGQHPLLLSFGARRLVALAGVLALGAPILILDEPTSGLDRDRAGRLFRLLRQRRQQGGAALLITHDLGLAAAHASRVIVLAGGRIVADGAPRQILTDPALLAAAGLAGTAVTRLAHLLAPLGLPPDALTADELAAAYERLYRARRQTP